MNGKRPLEALPAVHRRPEAGSFSEAHRGSANMREDRVSADTVAAAPAVAGMKVPPWHHFYSFTKDAILAWIDDYAPSMGAALSYYTLFSIAPMLLIVISVAGLAFGEEAARGHISATLSSFMGSEGAIAIEGLLKSVSLHNQGIVGTLIGMTLLLVGATSVFAELQNALDRIWRAPERNKPSGLFGLLRARLLSFGLILGLGFLMIVSLIASAALTALGEWWAPLFGGWDVVLQAVNFVVSFGLVTTVFAMIYKFMPSVRIAWRDVGVGAVVTAALFTVGKFLIGLYIGRSGVTSGFGAASTIVLLLVWVYYSAQIFLVGAEFTWVYAHRFGSRRAKEHEVETPSPARRGDDEPPADLIHRAEHALTRHDHPHPEPTLEQISALNGWTLLEFGASWCGICAHAQPEIQHALREFPLIRHLKVEDGPGRRLGRQVGIKLWPTLVLLRDGQETARLVRPANREVIADLLQRSVGSA